MGKRAVAMLVGVVMRPSPRVRDGVMVLSAVVPVTVSVVVRPVAEIGYPVVVAPVVLVATIMGAVGMSVGVQV